MTLHTKGDNHATRETITCSNCFTTTEVVLDTPSDRVYLDDILKEIGWKKGAWTGNYYCPDCAPTRKR